MLPPLNSNNEVGITPAPAPGSPIRTCSPIWADLFPSSRAFPTPSRASRNNSSSSIPATTSAAHPAAKPAVKRRYHAEHLERRAPERAVAGPELPGRAGRAANSRAEKPDRDRQPAGSPDRQRDRARPGPADSDAAPARDGDDEFAEHRGGQSA